MRKKIAKTLSVIAVMATLVAGMSSLSANAGLVDVSWNTSTSGSTTTYTATRYTSLTGNYVYCNKSSILSGTFAHNSTNVWSSTATNTSSIKRYTAASTEMFDIESNSWVTSAADYESGDTAVNGSRVASSNYSNFPTRYYLYYNAGIRGGTTTNPPLVTNIKFYEFYVS